jgi:hypothetical protein
MSHFYEQFSVLSFSDKSTLIVSWLGLLVSAITLILGYVAYNKFLNQKVSEIQLTVVLELIDAIYKYTFHIQVEAKHDNGGVSGSSLKKNLFQLAAAGVLPVDSPDNIEILIPNNYVFSFPAWKFIANPLLPNAISKELKGMRHDLTIRGTDTSKVERFMIIGEVDKEITNGTHIALSSYIDGYAGFLSRCRSIDSAIKAWLKKHGLQDLNEHVTDTPWSDWI